MPFAMHSLSAKHQIGFQLPRWQRGQRKNLHKLFSKQRPNLTCFPREPPTGPPERWARNRTFQKTVYEGIPTSFSGVWGSIFPRVCGQNHWMLRKQRNGPGWLWLHSQDNVDPPGWHSIFSLRFSELNLYLPLLLGEGHTQHFFRKVQNSYSYFNRMGESAKE